MRPERNRVAVISALGVVQILAWGSSFYLPAVLAGPVAADTGWPLAWVVAGLSAGLLVAAAISPSVGAAIARHGGRPVLATAAVLLAAGLVWLGLSTSLSLFMAGWLLMGLGMGCGLYDPAFATLGHLYGSEARSAITTLTLWGGFASTVCWPFSAYLVEHVGWRGACFAYAGIHLAVTLPAVLAFVPPAPATSMHPGVAPAAAAPPLAPRERRIYWTFASILILGGTVMGMVSVHLITLLRARGVEFASAITFGALIGPSQVAARVVEMAGKGRHHPLWTLTAAMLLIAAGLVLLAAGSGAVAVALVLYGAGNGIYSIARGTVPLALFGAERYATLVGRLARPGLVAQALAPLLGAFVLGYAGATVAFALLVALGLFNLGLTYALWRARPEAGGNHGVVPPARS